MKLLKYLIVAAAFSASSSASADVKEMPFLLQFTHEAASTAGIGRLDEVAVPENATEIRIWIGFGIVPPDQMLRLRVDPDGSISGELLIYFSGDFSDMSRKDAAYFHRQYTNNCTELKKGPDKETCIATFRQTPNWKDIYDQLVGLGITKLPDESELPKTNTVVSDGIAVVVEVRQGETYRAYEYSNPGFRQEPEAEAASQIIRIVAHLANESSGT